MLLLHVTDQRHVRRREQLVFALDRVEGQCEDRPEGFDKHVRRRRLAQEVGIAIRDVIDEPGRLVVILPDADHAAFLGVGRRPFIVFVVEIVSPDLARRPGIGGIARVAFFQIDAEYLVDLFRRIDILHGHVASTDKTVQRLGALVRDDLRRLRIVEYQALAQHDLGLIDERLNGQRQFFPLRRIRVVLAFHELFGDRTQMVEPGARVGQLIGQTGARPHLALEPEFDVAYAGRIGAADGGFHAALEVERLLLVHEIGGQQLGRLADLVVHLPALEALLGVL